MGTKQESQGPVRFLKRWVEPDMLLRTVHHCRERHEALSRRDCAPSAQILIAIEGFTLAEENLWEARRGR